MTDAVVVQIPRPKTPQNYDRGTTEQAYQSIEQALQNKHDRRGHLYLEPGKELILTSDNSSSQFGIGLDAAGYIRVRDMSDGSIGTFSVAWAQVDGAAQEIADLQAYVDAADSTLTGSVGVNAAAIAANGVSIAGIETEITAARDGETDLAAKFSSVEGALASGDAAIASDVTTLTARVGGTEAGLVKNAYFQEEFSGSAVPPEWTEWNNGLGTWQARAVGEGFAFSYAALGGNEGGIYQDVTVGASKRFLISAEIRRTAGTMAGAGVLVQWFDSGGTQLGFDSIEFENDENLDGVVSVNPDGPTRWEKEVVSPALSVTARIYAMNHFSTFGSNAVTNAMYWRECSLQLLTNAQAQVRVQGEAIADIEGNLSARYAIAVDGGGAGAFFSLEDGTSGPSSIILAAGDIILDGDAINFGSNTQFETTDDTFVTETGGYRYRYGGPFGTSDDILQWFGADSVSQGSETKTNGIFALATDGKVYYGATELAGNEFKVEGDPLIVAEASGALAGNSATTSAYSVTASNADGAITYNWYYVGGSTAITISNDSVSNPTWTGTPGAGNVIQAAWRLVAEDASSNKACIDVIVQLSDVF